MSFKQDRLFPDHSGFLSKAFVFLSVLCLPCMTYAQKATADSDNARLLADFIKSKGYSASIEFDAANIKQFWVDKSVLSKDDSIVISTRQNKGGTWESVPLKIQLANASESMDCRIDVIATSRDFSFYVTNSKSVQLSKSTAEDDFIQYHVANSFFHLEDAPGFSFNLVFLSKESSPISIKKIVFSFSNNKKSSVLASPGELRITGNDLAASKANSLSERPDKSILITEKQSTVSTSKFIPVTDNTISVSLKLRNTGDKPARIYTGFVTYSKEKKALDSRNYPYKNINRTLNVISVDKNAGKIVVDSYPEWARNCFLAWDAEDDLSDVPNGKIVNGKIAEVRKLENGQAEIVMNAPIKTALEKGAKVRIHGTGAYLYPNIKVLQPGEEASFPATIKKDDSSRDFSPDAFSNGIFFVKPIILSSEDKILITDYSISF